MSILSQIRNGEPRRRSIDRAAVVGSLISTPREAEHALRESIKAEEECSRLRDLNDPLPFDAGALDACTGGQSEDDYRDA